MSPVSGPDQANWISPLSAAPAAGVAPAAGAVVAAAAGAVGAAAAGAVVAAAAGALVAAAGAGGGPPAGGGAGAPGRGNAKWARRPGSVGRYSTGAREKCQYSRVRRDEGSDQET